MQDVGVVAVFAATISLLYLRPFGMRDWQIAGIGGLVAWAIGPLSPRDGMAVIGGSWNIVAFFAGLMFLAACADAAGLYRQACRLISRGPLVAVLVVGALVTTIYPTMPRH